MKNIRTQLLSLLLILVALPTFAEYVTTDGIQYSCDAKAGTAVVSDGRSCRGAITIPESVTLEGETYTVTVIGDEAFRGCKSITSVEIPESVTQIGSKAFQGCTGLMSVTIFASITEIGNSAFYECTGLNRVYISDLEAWCNITFGSYYSNPLTYARNLFLNRELVEDLRIPDGVTAIKDYAFAGCYITSATVPDSVERIGKRAFYDCIGMTYVTIGGSVESIYDEAFSGCISLTSATIPDSVKSIYANAFYGCTGLISVTIGDSVTQIGKKAFFGCTDLASVSMGKSVSQIEEEAFLGCTCLKEVHISDLKAWCKIDFIAPDYPDFESNPLFHAHNLYLGDELITDLVIPDGIDCVKKSAFAYCHGLKTVTIPGSVRSISDYSFYGCCNVSLVTIGESVNYIGKDSFNCAKLSTVNCLSTTPPGIGGEDVIIGPSPSDTRFEYFHPFGYDTYAVLHVPMGCKEAYRSAPVWKDFKNIVADIPGELDPNTVIVDGIQYYCDKTTGNAKVINWLESSGDVVIQDSVTMDGESYTVTSIGDKVFKDYDELTSVTISDSVVVIGTQAFYECNQLRMVKLGSSVERIGQSAFAFCKVLTSMTIPGSVKSIGESAFEYCYRLSSIDINEGVATIGAKAFASCSSLTSITIPNSVISIGISAFENCNGLTSISIPESITKIDTKTFAECPNLTSIAIPNSVTLIANSAFENCTGLHSVTFGNSLRTIGDSAFADCNSLTSVTIGSSLRSIGKDAFYGCKNLNIVNISDLSAWCKITFESDSSNPLSYARSLYIDGELITDLVIPEKIVRIKDYAFNSCLLASVTIPSSVSDIGRDAFTSCGLETITCHAPVPPSCDCYYTEYDPDSYYPGFDFDYFKYSPFGSYLCSYSCDLYVPAASVDSYREADVWKKFKNILPIGTTSVREISDTDGSVTITGNTISVDAEAGTPVNIYSLDGVLRYQGSGPAEVELPEGLYILRIGNLSRRIRI